MFFLALLIAVCVVYYPKIAMFLGIVFSLALFLFLLWHTDKSSIFIFGCAGIVIGLLCPTKAEWEAKQKQKQKQKQLYL